MTQFLFAVKVDGATILETRIGSFETADDAKACLQDLYGANVEIELMAEGKRGDQTLAGYRAGLSGRSEDSNPHRRGTADYRAWNDGWLEGFTEAC